MSKNITIQEGGVSKNLSSIKKIQTEKQGGGSVLWVPEDEVQLTTKHISANGTYKASDDGKYGYSQVTVSGVGQASGINPTTGNDAVVEVDPETEELEIKELPSSIEITTQPTKTEYLDGESIDTAGMVVKAYLRDGNLWEGDGYTGGVIPLSEITIDPTTADESSAQVSESVYKLGDLTATVCKSLEEKQYYGSSLWNEGTATAEGDAYIIRYDSGAYNVISKEAGGKAVTVNTRYGNETKIADYMISATIDGVTYTAYNHSIWAHASGGSGFTTEQSPDLPIYEADYIPTIVALYGQLVSGGGLQPIEVSWNRPNDNKELKTILNITVIPSNEDEGTGGGGGGSW